MNCDICEQRPFELYVRVTQGPKVAKARACATCATILAMDKSIHAETITKEQFDRTLETTAPHRNH
jgi:protein-arginine kinase activator protein McsA